VRTRWRNATSVALGLPDQLLEGLLAAWHHRVQRLADGLIRMRDRSLGERKQQPLLATYPFEVGQQLAFHAPLSPRVDLVDQGNQQLDQSVGDLGLPRPAQTRQQRQPHRLRAGAKVRGVLLGGPRPPCAHKLLWRVGEQPVGEAKHAQPLELVHLGEQGLQAGPARVGLQLRQPPTPCGGRLVLVLGDQLLQPLGRRRPRQPGHGRRAEPLSRRCASRPHDALHAAGRLDAVGAAAGQQRFPQPLVRRLHRDDLGGKPEDQLLLVSAAGLPEPQGPADLRSVVLDRATGPRVAGEKRRVHLDLPRQVVHRRRRHLAGVPRKACLQLEELQQRREAKPCGTGLVADQAPVALDERPALDQLLRLPVSPHHPTPTTGAIVSTAGILADPCPSGAIAQEAPINGTPLPCGSGHVRELRAFLQAAQSLSRSAPWAAVPPITGPGLAEQPTQRDDRVRQRQPELHDRGGALGAPAQLAEPVAPGVGALHRPPGGGLDRGRDALVGDLALEVALGQGGVGGCRCRRRCLGPP
jgi:hypothetical protein